MESALWLRTSNIGRLNDSVQRYAGPTIRPSGLSAAARSIWAKYDRSSDGWLPLWRHLADAGAVAGLLWDEWAPLQVCQVIGEGLPGGIGDARRLFVWMAATHDLGKATPAFACQVDWLAEAMRSAGLGMSEHRQMPDRKLAPHGLAGQMLIQEWLVERHGWVRRATLPMTVVAGGHHGVPPTYSDISAVNTHPELLRTPGCEEQWRKVQYELLDVWAEACGIGERLADWQNVKLSQAAQVLLSGLVIMADWIASNSDLFPYFPESESRTDTERVEAAWRGLDLPGPWRALESDEAPTALFASRFKLPPDAEIRPVQERAVEVARGMKSAGLMIVEAPMGEGKTEAALAVVEVFAARSGAGGCFVALPTMATGNGTFPRLLAWLNRLPAEETRSVFLAHSKAALNDDFADLMRAGRRAVRGIEQDRNSAEWRPGNDRRVSGAELVAHQWMVGRKKGLLSSFVVGTIDQLLFAGLKSRHLALRHLAVAGKVVVIDEAHAYDTYMNSYLDRVLSWLGAYRVPVVVLSATLPAGRRRELAEAYAGTSAKAGGFDQVGEADGYPLLTAVEPGRPASVCAVETSSRCSAVRLERLSDDFSELADRLARELTAGGCALVVRNTVDRVLETAAELRLRFGSEAVTVAHARFLDLDRAEKDAELRARFGPPDQSAGNRPVSTHIVVASQVAEQSLDIDFDLLVSDLCPIDLLLQRIGRLHRHLRGKDQSDRPAPLRTARCLVTGADWNAVPVEPVSGSQRIYRRHMLLRTAAVLEPYLSQAGRVLQLPEDISLLVQRAYAAEPVGPAEWQQAMADARTAEDRHQERQREKAEIFQINEVGRPGRALIGWLDAGVGDADDTRAGRAQVRDGRESLEVLVLQRLNNGTVRTVPWLTRGRGGLELPTDTVPQSRIARIVSACGLRLPFQFSLPGVMGQAIQELEGQCITAWQAPDCHWLAGELILFLDENCQTRLAGFDLTYSSTDGLEVIRAQ
jgi:CRISPR-associated endonuclease/helicase Cas3